MSKSKKTSVILLAVLILLIAGFALARFVFLPQAQDGEKNIVFQVTGADGIAKDFEITTDAETLADALLEHELIEAEEGAYGLWVTAVAGEASDSANNEYWMFYKDGAELSTGVSETYIADGEHYEAIIVRF